MNNDRLLIDSYKHTHCVEFDNHLQVRQFLSEDTWNSLKLIHLNIRSFHKNFDSLLVSLQSIEISFDVIVLTEAWLDPDKEVLTIDGYDTFHTTDNWNRNDGIVVYLKTTYNGSSSEIQLGDATGLQIDFKIHKRQYNILATYRSPSMNFITFLEKLTIFYRKLNSQTTYIFTGDINIDISTETNGFIKDEYLNFLSEIGFLNCINKPTRVTENSVSCIDHIFVKHNDDNAVMSGVYKTFITDHYAVLTKIVFAPDTDSKVTTSDDSFHTDFKVLNELMGAQTWDHVLALNDVNTSCETFLNTFAQLKKSSEKRKKKYNRLKPLKPWISRDLVYGIRVRDKVSKVMKKQPFNYQLRINFINFRTNLNNRIKAAKISYFKQKIVNCAGDPKQFWNTINEIRGIHKTKSSFPINQFVQGMDIGCGEVRVVANSFNHYFSKVGEELANVLPPPVPPPLVDDSAFRAMHDFRLEPVTDGQIVRCVHEMRGGSAPGVDEFPVSILKANLSNLLPPLKHIVNLSIESGIFPELFKISKVVPLFKSGAKNVKSNYRPISLLSVVSKIIEKCVKIQLQLFLENNSLLSEKQYGFRKGKNTADPLFAINKSIIESVNNNKKALMVFIDLAKAFDSIDRNSLLKKLECIGVRGVALSWFKSYFNGRKQVVSLNGTLSDMAGVNYGVVQGSTLGPLLFLIYINNIDKLNITGELFLFADDTALLFKGSSWKDTYETASNELYLIKKYFDYNVLTLNTVSLEGLGTPV